MEFAPGAITLDDIIGGTLQVGEVPNARLETDLTSLADALTAGGIIPHAHLAEYLATLAAALTAGGKVPHANLDGYLGTLAAALTAGGIVPHANLTGELATLGPALMAGGKVPHANLTGELVTLANALIAGGKVPHANLAGELGTLAAALQPGGYVPHEKFYRYEWSLDSTGLTVLTAVWTGMVAQDIGTLELGERILVCAQVQGNKTGLIDGDVQIQIHQVAGTATIKFVGPVTNYVRCGHILVPTGESIRLAVSGVGLVTVAGTSTLRLSGMSEASDAQVTDGQASLWIARVLPSA